MAPLNVYENDLDNEMGSGSSSIDVRLIYAIVFSLTTFFGAILLITMCGCCGGAAAEEEEKGKGKGKETKKVDAEEEKANLEKSKLKTTKIDKSTTVQVTEAGADKSKVESKTSKAASSPAYLDVGPAVPEPKPEAKPDVKPANQPHYFDPFQDHKPAATQKKPKPKTEKPLDHAPHREAAYRTMYGVGDDFQASDRAKPKGGPAASMQPDLATPAPKPRYLSMAPDLQPKLDQGGGGGGGSIRGSVMHTAVHGTTAMGSRMLK